MQEKTFSYLYDNYFCKGKLYALNCAAVAPDGTFVFGGSGGITVIYPDVPIEKEPDIPLNLDMILVNGEYIIRARKNYRCLIGRIQLRSTIRH